MQYYELVFPKLKSPIKTIFTYASESELNVGDLVEATLRNQTTFAIVYRKTEKPEFKTRPIEKVLYKSLLEQWQINLFEYIKDYYFGNPAKTINMFLPKKLEKIPTEIIKTEAPQEFTITYPDYKLNETQLSILEFLKEQPNKIHLIHGITGSGKTAIYLKHAEEIIKQDKQVLILIPEIALTPQTIKIFKDYFSEDLISVHNSKLNQTEQLNEWIKIKSGRSKVIIGSRSSLFLPFQKLGLIVMDEEHDFAYKQDQNPRYHARTILQWYHENLKVECIIGSATPSIETYSASTKAQKIIKHEILHRSQNQPVPEITIVDLKDEIKKGNPSIISETLFTEIEKTLKLHQQVLLLHNKRGFANHLLCLDCGEVVKCPNCSISLTLHKKSTSDFLLCHYCEFKSPVPAGCHKCHGINLKSIGYGIQKTFDEIQQLFPTTKILRVDSDTTSTKNAHSDIYEAMKQGHYDIIIGTQMIATGLDIGSIALVGVTNADIALNMPDFRTTERAFQLLTQISGRTGRSTYLGKVIIQTYNPEHPVIYAVKNGDIKNFYTQEIEFRKEFNYPPFSKLTKLTFSDSKPVKVASEIERVEKILNNLGASFKSAPALIEKKHNKYYHNIIITSLHPEKFIDKLELTPSWWIDRDPVSVL